MLLMAPSIQTVLKRLLPKLVNRYRREHSKTLIHFTVSRFHFVVLIQTGPKQGYECSTAYADLHEFLY